jgi:glycosyltransferase A (GT-A) superfamily protein (DUF2064 family)
LSKKTAILIFANSAEKALTSQSIQSAEVFEILNAKALKTAKKTGLPYFYYSENEQTGTSFGERFTNAIEAIYNEGFETVISIGTDIPHLKSAHILKAFKALETSDYVLGPSKDGGFYLMGFKKTYFNKIAFTALPWENSKLRRVLNTELQKANKSVSYLELLSDIDDISDIEFVLKSHKTLAYTIRKLLVRISRKKIEISRTVPVFFDFIVFKLHQNKGSPLVLHF